MLLTSIQAKNKKRLLLLSAFISLSACTHTNSANVAADKQETECAKVSVFFKPPTTQRLFPVSIFNIDGDNVNTETRHFKLSPGKHTLSIMHHISEPIGPGGSSGRGLRNGKKMELEVEANTTYHIGAKFISNKRYKVRDQEFWEPTIWKVEENNCRM